MIEININSGELDEVYAEWYTCPKCGADDILKAFEFCPICGSKIKWIGGDDND